jgi:aryl-alcohol dehydrogenase-like predicted oxidoreductase
MESIDLKKVKELGEISNSIGITQSQLAILWCLKNKNVSTVILGASNTKQLKELQCSHSYFLNTRESQVVIELYQ